MSLKRMLCVFSTVVGRDITHEHENLDRLCMGNSYLIYGKTNRSALGLLKRLARPDSKCLFITRSNPQNIKSIISQENIQVALLRSDRSGEHEIISDLDGLSTKIKQFSCENANSAILLDRIDYLLFDSSFDQFARSLYQIDDIISDNNSLLLLHLDPSILDKRQLSVLENELQIMPIQDMDKFILERSLYDLLKFIYAEEAEKIVISFKRIKDGLNLTYPTIRKRLNLLKEQGLITICKQGKIKKVRVTEKGKKILGIRKIS